MSDDDAVEVRIEDSAEDPQAVWRDLFVQAVQRRSPRIAGNENGVLKNPSMLTAIIAHEMGENAAADRDFRKHLTEILQGKALPTQDEHNALLGVLYPSRAKSMSSQKHESLPRYQTVGK